MNGCSTFWTGINALDAMAMAYNAIGLLRQQTLPSNRVHSIITNGGQAANSTCPSVPQEIPFFSSNVYSFFFSLSLYKLSPSWSQL